MNRTLSLLVLLAMGPLAQARAGGGVLAPVIYEEQVDGVIPWDFDADQYDAWLEDAMGRAPLGTTQVRLLGRGLDGEIRPLDAYLPVLSHTPLKERHELDFSAPVDIAGAVDGGLSNKAIYLSQCHGWIYSEVLGRFATQRGNVWDTVEDFHNPEGANWYLSRYIENAGGSVYATKERDLNDATVLVDNGDADYSETGAGFETGGNGFGWASTYAYGVDPFNAGNTRRFPGNGGGVASWSPDVPEDGVFGLYISWDAAADHSSAAHYRITHPGGVIDRWYNQRNHGSTWQYVDTLWLPAGNSVTVELIGDSASSEWVSVDAVRLGGGTDNIVRYGDVTGRPRWESGAIQYAQFNGVPSSIYDPYGDGDGSAPTVRSRWAEWEHPAGEDALYLSWHSNASGGTARGTITYFAGGGSDAPSNYPASCTTSGDAVDGSYSLARAVQDELIDAFTTNWDPSWQDRALGTSCFSEVSPGNNNEMPAALVELAFHDNFDDTLHLKHPRFRRDAARAMYRGVVRYFAERDGLSATFLPEPPVSVSLLHDGSGLLRLDWSDGPVGSPDGDAADYARVFLSVDGRTWDSGTDVTDGYALIRANAGTTVFARVSSVNDGGFSFPSEVVGARISPDDSAPVLVVSAFDRMDRGMLNWVQPGGSLGDIVRMDLNQMNAYNIAVPHGMAIAESGWFFESASDEAAASMNLDAFDVVVWATGEESTIDETVSAVQQAQLRSFWDGGGSLWVSGAEVFWDLDFLGDADDQAFAAEVLGAGMASDASGSNNVVGLGVLNGVGPMDFDVSDGAPYPVEFADVLASSRTVIAEYTTGETAAVLGSDVATFGFPFDTIGDPNVRTEVAGRLLSNLAPNYVPPSVGAPSIPTVTNGVNGEGTPPTTGTTSTTESTTTDTHVDPIGSEKKGCGCANGGAPGPMALWVGLAAVFVRRRRAHA